MVDGSEFDGDGNLRLAFATWVYDLHRAGVDPADEALQKACAELDGAGDTESGDAAGERLVRRVSALVGKATAPGAVGDLATKLYGAQIGSDLGTGSRADRTSRIRKYQFGRSLPWLARIYDRDAEGRVEPCWLLVEHLTDRVRAMDPNPWNDVDETRELPLQDFMVKWELDGCTALHVR